MKIVYPATTVKNNMLDFDNNSNTILYVNASQVWL